MRKIMNLPGEMKSFGDTGYFAGYASMFDYIDSQMDVVLHGAFERTLAENAEGRDIKLLWQHDPKEPVGYFTNIIEDNHGLYVEGYIQQEVQKGKEAYALLKSGAVRGLSIGYNVKNYNVDHKTGIRIINDLDLFEISLVTFPANDMAKIIEVKSGGSHSMPEQMAALSYSIDRAINSLKN